MESGSIDGDISAFLILIAFNALQTTRDLHEQSIEFTFQFRLFQLKLISVLLIQREK